MAELLVHLLVVGGQVLLLSHGLVVSVFVFLPLFLLIFFVVRVVRNLFFARTREILLAGKQEFLRIDLALLFHWLFMLGHVLAAYSV